MFILDPDIRSADGRRCQSLKPAWQKNSTRTVGLFLESRSDGAQRHTAVAEDDSRGSRIGNRFTVLLLE